MPMELHGFDVAAGSLCRTAASSKLAAVFVQNMRILYKMCAPSRAYWLGAQHLVATPEKVRTV